MFVRHALACCFLYAFPTANATIPATVVIIASTTRISASVIPAECLDLFKPKNPLSSVGIVVLQFVFEHEVAQDLLGDVVESVENIRSGDTIPSETADVPFSDPKEKVQRIDGYELVFGEVSLVVKCRPRYAVER